MKADQEVHQMTEQEFLRKMQDDVLVTEDPVTMDLRLDASDLWDSLSIVGFIAMAKMTAGKKRGFSHNCG